MKKNNIIWIVGGILVVGAAGFFLYKKFQKKAEENLDKKIKAPETPEEAPKESNPVKDTVSQIIAAGGGILGGIGAAANEYLSNYNDYVVNTISSNLYLRETPNAQGKILGKFTKGSIIKAKASGTKGWFAVSEDGSTVKGYVSSMYLKSANAK